MKLLLYSFWFLSLIGKSPYEGETYICDEYYQYCLTEGTEYDIEPELIMAIVERESSGIADAVNGNCKGLMQINEPFHAERMKKNLCTDLFEPFDNITVGTDYIKELYDEYGDMGYALGVYAGYTNAYDYYINGQLTPYAKDVLDRASELRNIHERWAKRVETMGVKDIKKVYKTKTE